jgi:hypothetical protein
MALVGTSLIDAPAFIGGGAGLSFSSTISGLGSETGAVANSDTLLAAFAKINDRLPLSGGTLTGDILNPNAGAYNQPQFRIDGYETGISLEGNTRVSFVSNGIGIASVKANEGLIVRSTESIGWSNAEVNGSATVKICRDADDILGQRRGSNAQEFRVYGTYTSASIYERLAIRTASGDYLIAAEAAGGGTLRNLLLNGANRSAYIASPTATEIRDILIAWGIMAAS